MKYAKKNVTIKDLKKRLSEFADKDFWLECELDSCGLQNILYNHNENVAKDLSKIKFTFENVCIGSEFDMPGYNPDEYEMIDGFPVAWCAAGGDCEIPLAFIVYIGEDDKIRGYLPEDGNCFNRKTMCAYGNEDDEDEAEENYNKDHRWDMEKIRAEVNANVGVRK
jgi:hypothetical protein